MKTTQKALQSGPVAALTAVIADAAYQLARINSAAFASRPLAEAVAAVRVALAARPGSSTPAAAQAAARKAKTAAAYLACVEAAPQYSPGLFADALIAHGLSSRAAIVETLRAYTRAATQAERLAALRAATADRKGARMAAARRAEPAADDAEELARRRLVKQSGLDAAEAARLASKPQADASANENAQAKRGYAFLRAAGAFD